LGFTDGDGIDNGVDIAVGLVVFHPFRWLGDIMVFDFLFVTLNEFCTRCCWELIENDDEEEEEGNDLEDDGDDFGMLLFVVDAVGDANPSIRASLRDRVENSKHRNRKRVGRILCLGMKWWRAKITNMIK